jgi:Ca2+-binding RTX toxin-like protein
MCMSCELDKSVAREARWGSFSAADSSVHFQKATASRYYADAFADPDGVGDKEFVIAGSSAEQLAITALIIDEVPDDTSSTATLEIGGPRVFSTINTPGDQDFYKVELQAGVTYEFGMISTTNGPSGIPLADCYVEIYDAAGNLLTSGDGGAHTQLNDVNTGLDVLLAFTAETTGTYYVNARAFDEAPAGGETGEFVGDYEAFARLSNYIPYYDLDSPLHSIDWGTQFDGTSRNPDGAEGPRVTGNEVENKIGGKNVLSVYFAREGEIFVDGAANPTNLTTTMVAKGLESWERQAFENVFAEYEKVADLDYVETDDRYAADIVVITYDGTPGPGLSLLGRMSPPDTASEGQTEYNSGDERWTQQDLAPGGFYFGTLIHEFGHGHGMAHPHDTGGRSSEMRGVVPAGIETPDPGPTIPDPVGVWPNYTLGDYNLNQGVYTMMSYQDGWQLAPWGPQLNELGRQETKSGFGWIGSLMALDIAVIQDKYGVNEEWATGNDTYRLSDENVAATFDADGKVTRDATAYRSIWDGAGVDQIVYSGNRDANIDLRPATLEYEYGGGGWISWAWGIHGGYTIANSVTIENATSGSGKDNLTGNDAANVLNGGANADVMSGGKGNDTYRVDNAGDKVIEKANEGSDSVYASASFSLAPDSHVESLGTTNASDTAAINLGGSSSANSIYGNAGANTLNGGAGNDSLNGLGGNDLLIGGAGTDSLSGGAGNDSYRIEDGLDLVYEAAGGGEDSVSASVSYRLNSGASVELIGTTNAAGTGAIDLAGNDYNNSIYGNAGNNALSGDGGSDNLVGLAGNDVLIGGGGNDVLRGGAGADEYRFVSNLNSGNVDSILDFSAADDTIVLDDAVFAGLGLGGLAAGAFATGPAAADADDRIVYNSTTGALLFDADGNGAGAAIQFATLNAGLALTASDFTVI